MKIETLAALQQARAKRRAVTLATRLSDAAEGLIYRDATAGDTGRSRRPHRRRGAQTVDQRELGTGDFVLMRERGRGAGRIENHQHMVNFLRLAR